MKRAFQTVVIAVLAAPVLVLGQEPDATRVLADLRAALGGGQATEVRTLAVEGTSTRTMGGGQSRSSGFEMAIAFPDKFVRKSSVGNINGTDIMRSTGFNGDTAIDKTDMPPMGGRGGGGGQRVVRMGPGGASFGGGEPSPEEEAAQRADQLRRNRADFARLALGLFGNSTPAVPLEFIHAGIAESPSGSAHMLDVKGPDDFAVRLFVDVETHLPLMLSWMALEPLTVTAGGPMMVQRSSGSAADAEQMRQAMEARMREAEANRKTVEYRLFYADFKTFDGIRLPTRIQSTIDGEAVEELTFERVRVNPELDPEVFTIDR